MSWWIGNFFCRSRCPLAIAIVSLMCFLEFLHVNPGNEDRLLCFIDCSSIDFFSLNKLAYKYYRTLVIFLIRCKFWQSLILGVFLLIPPSPSEVHGYSNDINLFLWIKGIYHYPFILLRSPSKIFLLLCFIVHLSLLSVAVQTWSHSCPIEIRLVLMFLNPCDILACVGSDSNIGIIPWDVELNFFLSSFLTFIGIYGVLIEIIGSFMKCEVNPVSTAAMLLHWRLKKLSTKLNTCYYIY